MKCVPRPIFTATILIPAALTMSGCATLQGAAIGGVAGAGVAAVTGKSVETGAIVGGVAGGAIGTAIR